MTGFIIFLHVLISIFLVVTILMQSGRGGGLTESFSSAENVFGAKTNVMMTRITTGLAVLFLITALSLAFLSAQKSKSLMAGKVAIPQGEELPTSSLPSEETVEGNESDMTDKVNDSASESANETTSQNVPETATVPATE
ncbi:MAG: preprotein translocase subunit SecG [Candidatus Omnitrophica bacterium]|nr:preprotein translocase subunit SecG [Candidatus Omnitrophota bacterium]